MILSRGRRFIFVHFPKTGGTALALALEGRAMKEDILIGDTPKARERRGCLHFRCWNEARVEAVRERFDKRRALVGFREPV